MPVDSLIGISQRGLRVGGCLWFRRGCNSELGKESDLDVDVDGVLDDTVQALVSPRMSDLTLAATVVGACGGA